MNFHEGLSPRYCYPHFTAKDTVSKTNCSSFQGSQIIQVLGLVFAPKQHDSLIILYSFSIQTDTPANSDGCCYFYHLYCTLFFFFFFSVHRESMESYCWAFLWSFLPSPTFDTWSLSQYSDEDLPTQSAVQILIFYKK